MTDLTSIDVERELEELYAVVEADRWYNIGYPGATDLTVPVLSKWLKVLLNNIGDPYQEGRARNQTKALERKVVDMVGDLMGAPPSRWGYVTNGSTEGTEHALYDARKRWRDVVVYTSDQSHYSVPKIAEKLEMPLVRITSDETGRIDVHDLAGELARRRDRAAIVVATAGTTMTEAIDDVPAIVKVFEQLAIRRRHIHVDAALSGIPLALLPAEQRPAFDFRSGATSMVISGHKFLSTLMPCGVLLYAGRPAAAASERITYTETGDTTITGSRSGHAPLMLWYILNAFGHNGRAERARQLAEYACQQLRAVGVPARRNPHAMTVYFPPMPESITKKWVIPHDTQRGHIVCMPGIQPAQVTEFVADVRAALPPPAVASTFVKPVMLATSGRP
ncbi:histidine decarboxylase [Allocatelliglobosispora scoriae]|uniref:Histidine decarboxylase n=1 Tax=Allocatelliglobosispora scoriae TaxID=643052 RepID=A0A841BYW9_9ACTN|nr:histidine decarboxylase [Allocatelliglobosispora scoriae]MBB5871861.1 histidine decarboxylase [Allocatelliglobosispora scoriae]